MRASDFITEQPVPPKKPGTIAVTNMPVYDKNISMKDQQMQKFKQQMQKDGGYQYASQATKDAIKQSDKRVRDALRKQARVDAIGGAGASTIQRVKPVTFDPKNSASNVKIAMDDINEQPVTTTNAQGVTTTVDKRNNRVTTKSDMGTVVKDRSGRTLSVQTPKIGGFQAKQTFRPDATPGYQQATYTQGPTTLGIKGSPETGYTKTASADIGPISIKQTDATARGGGNKADISYQLNPNKTLKATVPINKNSPIKTTKAPVALKQSQFEDVQNAIREHVKQGIPFTECMFRAGSPAFTEFYRQVREVADKLNLDWQDQELLTTDIGECIMVEGELVPLDVPMIDEGNTPYDDDEEMTPEEEAFVDMVVDYYYDDDDYERSSDYDYERMERAYSIAGGDPSDTVGRANFLHREITQRLGLSEDINEAEYQGRKVKLNSPKRGGSKKFYVYVKNPKTGRVKKISWGDITGLSVKAKDRGAVRSFVARHKCKQANDKMTARYWSCRTPRYKALGVKGGQWW